MNKVVVARNVFDLEKLRECKGSEKVTLFILNDIHFDEENSFYPINLENTDVIVYGLTNTLHDLVIEAKYNNYVGLFSNVRNLYVKNLNVKNALVLGNEVCGILAGHIDEELSVDGCDISGSIISDAITGGLAGSAGKVNVNKSLICSTISGRGCLAGVAGMADSCDMNDSLVNATFKPTQIVRNGKCLIDQYVAYLGTKEAPRVEKMAMDVNDFLEERNACKRMLL